MGLAKYTQNKELKVLEKHKGTKTSLSKNCQYGTRKERSQRRTAYIQWATRSWPTPRLAHPMEKQPRGKGTHSHGPPLPHYPLLQSKHPSARSAAFALLRGFYLWLLVFIGISKESIPKGKTERAVIPRLYSYSVPYKAQWAHCSGPPCFY